MNFIKTLLYIFLLIVTVSCSRVPDYCRIIDSSDPIHIQLADQEMFSFANEMLKEGFVLVGYGGAMRLNVQSFSMTFIGAQQVDVDGSRRIFIEIINRFLERVNASERLRPYLSTYPMTIKNLKLKILFSPSLVNPFENYVTSVSLLNTDAESQTTFVLYGRYHPENEITDFVHQESYQRAVGILEHQNNAAGLPPFCLE